MRVWPIGLSSDALAAHSVTAAFDVNACGVANADRLVLAGSMRVEQLARYGISRDGGLVCESVRCIGGVPTGATPTRPPHLLLG